MFSWNSIAFSTWQFFKLLADIGNLISGSSSFLKVTDDCYYISLLRANCGTTIIKSFIRLANKFVRVFPLDVIKSWMTIWPTQYKCFYFIKIGLAEFCLEMVEWAKWVWWLAYEMYKMFWVYQFKVWNLNYAQKWHIVGVIPHNEFIGKWAIRCSRHLLSSYYTWTISQNFPQFIVIYTIKDFGIVNKAEIDVFLELSCFFNDPAEVGNLISGSSAFSKTSLNIWKFTVHILLKPGLENFKHYFTSVWDECNCAVVWAFFGIAFLWDWNENGPFPVLWPLLNFSNLLAYWVQHFHSIIFQDLK